MFGNRQAAGGGSRDCAEDIKKWWEQFPVKTVAHFFFWTTCTTFIIPRDFFDWLIGLYLVYHDGKRIENKIGTVHYILELVVKNFLIQVFYIAIMYIFQLIFGGQYIIRPSQGLFPTFMLLLTLRGLVDPEQERPFMCFPVMVKNKWYAWILYGIICLISMSLVPDLLCAIGVAYAEVYVFKGQLISIKKETLQRWENACLFSKLRNRSDFVTVQGAGGDGYDMSAPMQQQQQQSAAQPQPSSAFNAFQGRGISIGQSSGETASQFVAEPQVVINPSQQQQQQSRQPDQRQEELRRAAAEAAMRRMEQEQESKDNQQDQQEYDVGDQQQNNQGKQKKKGYDQLNEDSQGNEDLL